MAIVETVPWAKDRKEAFIAWMEKEIHNAIGDRQELERKWKSELIQWRARLIGDGVTDVPFVGASDLEIPLTAMHTDPVFADFMQTLHVPRDFWSVVGKKQSTVDKAKPLQEYLSIIEQEEIDMYEVNQQVAMDQIIHGTGIYKDIIKYEGKKVRDYDENGDIVEKTRVQFKPEVQYVPLQDFFIPAYSRYINPDAPQRGAPWVAHRFDLRAGELRVKSQGAAPFAPNWDKEATALVETWVEEDQDDIIETTQRDEDRHIPWQDRKIKLYEIWARFDVDDDGIEEDIVVIFHYNSGVILRAIFNPFLHGKRPFEAIYFMPGKGFYGIGLAEMDAWAQMGASRLLNATLDSAFLGNAIMLGVPMGANVAPDEPIYSGKIWPLAPGEQIQDISFGSADPAAFQMLSAFMEFSEKRTGVGELRQGSIDGLPSRTPASTVLSILNEGKKRFDMIMTAARRGPLKRIGVRLLQNLIQISRDDPRFKLRAVEALGEKDSIAVLDFLNSPLHEVESLFGVSVTATSSQVNKEVDKQNLVALAQTLTGIWQQQIQYGQLLAQMTQDPNTIVEPIQSAYLGSKEMVRRILEAYDIQNPDNYIVDLAAQQQQQQQQPAAQPGGAQPGAPAAAGGFPTDPEAELLQLLLP